MNTVAYYRAPITNTAQFSEREIEGIIAEIRTSTALRESCAMIRDLQDKKQRNTVKAAELPYFTPHGICSPTRANENFKRASGILLFDVDHVEDVKQLKARLVEDQHVAFAFVSPSGDGLKFGGFTDADIAGHEQRWTAAAAYFTCKYGIRIDTAPRALASACYLSFDPDAFFNPRAAALPCDPQTETTAAGATPRGFCSSIEEAIREMDPKDQGDKFEVSCPKCKRHEAYVFKQGDARIRCAHKHSCGYISEPLVEDQHFHLSDDGNAQRFVLLHGDKLLFCNGRRRRWYCWDDVRFQEDRVGRVLYLARDVPQQIKAEADALPQVEGTAAARKKLYAHSIATEGAHRLKSLVELAAVHPRVAVTPEMLDRDPWRLCVRNGYLNLRSGELEPPDPERLVTKQAAVKFDPSATCPRWDDMIAKVTCGRKDLADFLQLLLGYVLTGETYEDKFFLFIGAGANGKTTLLETIVTILGDYAVVPPQGTFIERKFNNPSGASPELALLHGARLATMSETNQGDRIALGLLKRLASGGKGTARDLFSGLESDAPTVKIIIDTNHPPRITGSDHGTWRRVCRIPFDYRFEGAELLPDFRAKMVRNEYGEHSGILNWMLKGCLAWQQAGRLEMPGEVEAATEDYRRVEDPVTRFLDERTTAGEAFATGAGILYKAFREWIELNGERVEMSNVRFADEMKSRGFQKTKTMRGTSYRGLALNETKIKDQGAAAQGEGF